jgi:hypothetical protein
MVNVAATALFGGTIPEHRGEKLLARRHLADMRQKAAAQTKFEESDRDRQPRLTSRDK